MDNSISHDPLKEINELRNQLSYAKRIGVFCGAGTSKALGISDMKQLTSIVHDSIIDGKKVSLDSVVKTLAEEAAGKIITIEDILNHLRLVRQITLERKSKSFDGIDGETAKELDIEICNKIYEIVSEEKKKANLVPIQSLLTWMNWLSRDFSKEIFTTNYDLVIERALESLRIPYYDGFVGANEPFFLSESLDGEAKYDKPPMSWIRLWKIHGSLGWFWKAVDSGSPRIVRLGVGAKKIAGDQELVIYPSREKYESSRKQPFVAYLDRLKSFLLDGEGLFIISGYSFSDEHINAIIFDGLKQNSRLHILGFFFSDGNLTKLNQDGKTFPNFSAYGAKKAIVKGLLGDWKKSKSDELLDVFWDEKESKLRLGDFRELVKFLLLSSGKKEKIEAEVRSPK